MDKYFHAVKASSQHDRADIQPTPIVHVCRECHARLQPNHRFCPDCGTPAPTSEGSAGEPQIHSSQTTQAIPQTPPAMSTSTKPIASPTESSPGIDETVPRGCSQLGQGSSERSSA